MTPEWAADTSAEAAGAVGAAEGQPAPLRREPGLPEREPLAYVLRRRRIERFLAWAVPLAALAAWQVATVTHAVDTQFFPAPSSLWTTGVAMARSGDITRALGATIRRIMVGLALGASAGVGLGVVMGVFPLLRAAFEPLLSGLYVVPKLALLPVLLVVFGIGDRPTEALIAIAVFFVMWISTMAAVQAVPEEWREPARTLGAGRAQLIRHVLWPAALPQVLVALRLAVGTAILVAVGVEFVQGADGIGHLIWTSWSLFLVARMYVGIIVVALLGVTLNVAVRVLGRVVAPWAEPDRRVVPESVATPP